jgi:hypothetical protein
VLDKGLNISLKETVTATVYQKTDGVGNKLWILSMIGIKVFVGT